jgi:hypothetical protein
MFDHIHGVTRALAKKKTPWNEDLLFTVKLAQQKLFKYYAEVTPTMDMRPIFAHNLDPLRRLRLFRKWDNGMHIISENETSWPTQYQEAILKYMENKDCAEHRCVQLINSNTFRATISFPLQRLVDPVNHPLIHMICPAMMKDSERLTMRLRRHPDEAIVLQADRLP